MIFSYSAIKAYEQCPLKFKLKYIDKIRVEERTIEQILGDCVHRTLEELYRKVMRGEIPSISDLNTHFIENFEESLNSNKVRIVKGKVEDYKQKGLNCLENYYFKNYPFNEDKTIFLEKKIKFRLGDFKFKGIVDRLSVKDSLNQNKILIHDYKTSNSFTKEDHFRDRQLDIYSIYFREVYPNYGIIKVHHLLSKGETFLSKVSDMKLQSIKKEMINKMVEISKSDYFPPVVSYLCNWCEFRRICPAWI